MIRISYTCTHKEHGEAAGRYEYDRYVGQSAALCYGDKDTGKHIQLVIYIINYFVLVNVGKKNTGSIYDCTVNDVITSYMHTITISSHQRYSRMIKGAHSLRSNK